MDGSGKVWTLFGDGSDWMSHCAHQITDKFVLLVNCAQSEIISSITWFDLTAWYIEMKSGERYNTTIELLLKLIRGNRYWYFWKLYTHQSVTKLVEPMVKPLSESSHGTKYFGVKSLFTIGVPKPGLFICIRGVINHRYNS